MRQNLDIRRVISLGVLLSFFLNTFGVATLSQAQSVSGDFRLPAPGVMVHLSPEFNPPVLKGLKVHPDNPFKFDFILDKGDFSPRSLSFPNVLIGDPQKEQLMIQANKLIKYFLASITIPEKDLWVNLSPYEKNRIIPQSFGLTAMGRDLLGEDYMLKQITSSLIYPEDEVGSKFWKRIYQEAFKKFGTTNIPVNTFNKVWIVPEKAVVYENVKAGTAYIVQSKLKVMLEEDYLALYKNNVGVGSKPTQERAGYEPAPTDINQLGFQIVREIVIPQLTKEVNEDKNFAPLHQVYNSLILATWYKKKIKDSILVQVYADQRKVSGVGYEKHLIGDPEHIYQRYLKAFKKGAYNYIKEEIDPMTKEMVPRRYFSGGLDYTHFNSAMTTTPTVDAPINSQGLDIISAEVAQIPRLASRRSLLAGMAATALLRSDAWKKRLWLFSPFLRRERLVSGRIYAEDRRGNLVSVTTMERQRTGQSAITMPLRLEGMVRTENNAILISYWRSDGAEVQAYLDFIHGKIRPLSGQQILLQNQVMPSIERASPLALPAKLFLLRDLSLIQGWEDVLSFNRDFMYSRRMRVVEDEQRGTLTIQMTLEAYSDLPFIHTAEDQQEIEQILYDKKRDGIIKSFEIRRTSRGEVQQQKIFLNFDAAMVDKAMQPLNDRMLTKYQRQRFDQFYSVVNASDSRRPYSMLPEIGQKIGAKSPKAMSVLNLGSGTGNEDSIGLVEMDFHDITHVDFSKVGMNIFRQRLQMAKISPEMMERNRFIVGDMTEVLKRLPIGHYDIVHAQDSMQYMSISKLRSTFRQVERVLKPNGLFIFKVPSTSDLRIPGPDEIEREKWEALDDQGLYKLPDGQIIRFFSEDFIRAQVGRSGFSVEMEKGLPEDGYNEPWVVILKKNKHSDHRRELRECREGHLEKLLKKGQPDLEIMARDINEKQPEDAPRVSSLTVWNIINTSGGRDLDLIDLLQENRKGLIRKILRTGVSIPGRIAILAKLTLADVVNLIHEDPGLLKLFEYNVEHRHPRFTMNKRDGRGFIDEAMNVQIVNNARAIGGTNAVMNQIARQQKRSHPFIILMRIRIPG